MGFLVTFTGSLGTSVFDTDVYLVGASGGVYALLAAHLANVLLNYNNMEFGIVRLIGIFVIGEIFEDRIPARFDSLVTGFSRPWGVLRGEIRWNTEAEELRAFCAPFSRC